MIDKRILYLAGAAFLGIAGALTIRELDLGLGWSVTLVLAALAAVAHRDELRRMRAVATCAFAVLGVAGPAGYFAMGRELSFYVATVLYFGAGMLLALRLGALKRIPDSQGTKNPAMIAAVGAVIVSSLSFWWLTYFRYLTSMQDAFVVRRVIFTMFLLTIGIVLNILSRSRRLPVFAFGGAAYLGVGVVKALAYDTTHLTGFLRIGAFALGGLVLFIGARLLSRKEPS